MSSSGRESPETLLINNMQNLSADGRPTADLAGAIDSGRKATIVLNGTTLVKGGGVQACVGFVQSALTARDAEINWRFFISKQVAEQLLLVGCQLDCRFRVFPVSPARSPTVRRQLRDAVDESGANAVFTFFGPAYVRFKQPHLCGIADGWVTHATRLAYSRQHGVKGQATTFAKSLYKAIWLRRASGWVVEADCARRGLERRFGMDAASIHVVPNNCGEQYIRASENEKPLSYKGTIRVLTLSAYYRHKNLELIPSVATLLKSRRPGRFHFVLTLPESDPNVSALLAHVRAHGLDDVVENVGPVSVIDAPRLYSSCHVAFLPSLLETFSANYPEAMVMRRPVVTSALDFARDVCREAALYVDPTDPMAMASALEAVADDATLRMRLVEAGVAVQRALPDQAARYRAYKTIVLSLLVA